MIGRARISVRGVFLVLMLGACSLNCDGRPPRVDAPAPVHVDRVDPQSGPMGAAQISSDTGTPWTLAYESAGKMRVRYRGTDMLSARYSFFNQGWQWLPYREKELDRQGDATAFTVEIPGLGLRLSGRARKTGPVELTYEFTLRAERELHGVAGGGFELSLSTDSGTLPNAKEPELLEGSRGMRWEVEPGQAIELMFDRALPRVSFEGGKNRVRTFFLPADIPAGEQHFKLRVRIPETGSIAADDAAKYGAPDATWQPNTMLWDQWPVDLRFLNAGDRPAGSHGPVQAKGDQLVFADGTPVRFWGTNLQAFALMSTPPERICQQAERIAAFGYNLVRFHHHDSPWVRPNIFDASAGNTQQIDARSVDRLDQWIKCLAEQGVYVFLDLNVGRNFLPGDDVPGNDELDSRMGPKGAGFVNPRMEALMQKFAHDYLKHENPYRKRRYLDDPAIIGVMITNENDLTHHFVHHMLPGKGHPQHTAMLEQVLQRVVTEDKLDSIDAADLWKPGPGSIALSAIEARFFRRAMADLRKLGVKVPIVTSSYWGNATFAQLPGLALGDMVDAHSYGLSEYLSLDPRTGPSYLDWISAAQVAGKPFSISEWALEHDKRDRFVTPVHFAAVAVLQGWDAPMHFTYQQAAFAPPQRVQMGSNSYDPAIMALMPAAALLFRRGDVSPAKQTFIFDLSEQEVYEKRRSPATSLAVRTLTERSRIAVALPDLPQLPWDGAGRAALSAPGVTVLKNLDQDFMPPGEARVVSDTGELVRDFRAGVQTVNTARTQAAAGWLGGRVVELGNAVLRLRTGKVGFALSSLDGSPIASSSKILLSAVAQVEAGEGGRLPYLAQPVLGDMLLRGTRPDLVLIPLTPGGQKLAPIKPQVSAGSLAFRLPERAPSHWFLLEPMSPSGD